MGSDDSRENQNRYLEEENYESALETFTNQENHIKQKNTYLPD